MPEFPILAFDVGGTKIAAAIILAGRRKDFRHLATPRSGRGEDIVAAMVELSRDLRWSGLAVATTGIVRNGHVTALNPATLPIEDNFPIADAIEGRYGQRPLVVNDAHAAGWGEYRRGAGIGAEAMLFITVSTGIGGAIIRDGRLIEGGGGLAGHFGHVSVAADGPLCGCGRRGCLEAVASGTAIAQQARTLLGRDARAPDVFSAAAAGDADSIAILDRAAACLALAIGNAVAMLDIDRVVLGGGVGLAEGFADRLLRQVDALPPAFCCPVVVAALGPDAGLIGAAQLLEDLPLPSAQP